MRNVLVIVSIFFAISSVGVESKNSVRPGDLEDHCSKTTYCGRGFHCCDASYCCPNNFHCCWPPRCKPSCCKYPSFIPGPSLPCPWE